MGIFINKPTEVPGVGASGISPQADICQSWNRTGSNVTIGQPVQLALFQGAATEIATNDTNSYRPGASNDTVWNTVIRARSDATLGSSIQRGGIFGVGLDQSVADNTKGSFLYFGWVKARVVTSNGAVPGDPLTIKVGTTFANMVFDNTILSNETIIATFADRATSNTSPTNRTIFLHNGLFAPHITGSGGFS